MRAVVFTKLGGNMDKNTICDLANKIASSAETCFYVRLMEHPESDAVSVRMDYVVWLISVISSAVEKAATECTTSSSGQ
jgi:hypothetical protein